MRRRAKVDSTHREVIDTLRQLGWDVEDTHTLPNFVDAVAMRGEQVRLIEIKGVKNRLQPSQKRLIDRGWPIVILRSMQDAINLR